MSTSIPLPRLGIDLLSDETQMPAGTVRAAVNVDIDKRGQFARRRGSALTTPGHGYDNLFPWGRRMLTCAAPRAVTKCKRTRHFGPE